MDDKEHKMPGDKSSLAQTREPDKAANANSLAYVAIGLSVMALLVSVLEVSYLYDEVRSQSWPYLQFDMRYSQNGFELSVKNKGVGPAKVRSVEMYLDDEKINNVNQAIADTIGIENAFSYDVYQMQNPAPGVMSADETSVLFRVPWQANTRMLIQNWSNRINLKACYCSVYDECWMAQIKGTEPEQVDACE